jgi:hypothetical protein
MTDAAGFVARQSPKKTPSIAALYPDLTPAQREQAEHFWRRYLDLVKRIHLRVRAEKQPEAQSRK